MLYSGQELATCVLHVNTPVLVEIVLLYLQYTTLPDYGTFSSKKLVPSARPVSTLAVGVALLQCLYCTPVDTERFETVAVQFWWENGSFFEWYTVIGCSSQTLCVQRGDAC